MYNPTPCFILTRAGVKSQKITSMLQFVPYALRAKDVQIVIPTVNNLYNVVRGILFPSPMTLFMYIPMLNVDRFGACGRGLGQDLQFFEQDNRTLNRFSITINGNTISGSTCWVGFNLLFKNPGDMNHQCLMELNKYVV
jgi:hypothetical protein